ncbi:cytochrome c biogenesis heme-transporting ATPase CcmA [Aliagarivorans marinus]|uniref:cytochrome c biogenesis heme-transporting ATPase CcmA n=1 Tax=Aliagarivorans marinus TaxID=561965 RepID=UPI00047B25A9|nr:cytochrome c biogenesis heme-transporting ATPase CcmA [Aliagarivorans marinus]
MLHAKELACTRDQHELFSGLNFSIQQGQIIQIAGVNGAGKTSLLRLLAGLSLPASGEVLWQGESIQRFPQRYHQQLLYLGHLAGIKSELSALENLQFFKGLDSIETPEPDYFEILARVGLAGLEDEPCAHLSAGQQRRVALARLWVNQRLLWILDEPFTAIDKQGVAYLEKILLQHCERGGMVILTTHQSLQMPAQHYRVIELSASRGLM